jgi:hypothetical protein
MILFSLASCRWRDNQIPGFVPGMDPEDFKKKEPTKTKAQKRNENKKKKKADGAGQDSDDDEDAGVQKATASMAAAKVSEEPAAESDPKEAINKKVLSRVMCARHVAFDINILS